MQTPKKAIRIHLVKNYERYLLAFSLPVTILFDFYFFSVGSYTERTDLSFEPFFCKRDKACNRMIARYLKF
jgi:hypothetical protein